MESLNWNVLYSLSNIILLFLCTLCVFIVTLLCGSEASIFELMLHEILIDLNSCGHFFQKYDNGGSKEQFKMRRFFFLFIHDMSYSQQFAFIRAYDYKIYGRSKKNTKFRINRIFFNEQMDNLNIFLFMFFSFFHFFIKCRLYVCVFFCCHCKS